MTKNIILLGVCGFMMLFSSMANAMYNGQSERTPKYLTYVFVPKEADLDRRYHTGWDNAYNSDWEYPYWTPYDWAQDAQTAQRVIDGFYENGVIERQYVDRKTGSAVIEIGQTWLDMAGRDKRRVVEFIAYAFGFDQSGEAIELVMHRNNTCHPMGIYTNGHVQLH